jgi:hypothetical protein
MWRTDAGFLDEMKIRRGDRPLRAEQDFRLRTFSTAKAVCLFMRLIRLVPHSYIR